MSKQVETAFEKLLGDCTDEERQKIYRMKDALGLQPHDALWMILFALQYHHRLYEKIPGHIEAASVESAKSAAYKAQQQINSAVAQLVPTVEKAVETAASQAVRRISLTRSATTFGAAAMFLGIIILMSMAIGFGIGRDLDSPTVRDLAMYAGAYAIVGSVALLTLCFDYVIDKERGDKFSVSWVTAVLVALFAMPAVWYLAAMLLEALKYLWMSIKPFFG